MESRNIVLSGYVTNDSVGVLIQRIQDCNFEDDYQQTKVLNYERKPIILTINSFGGSLYDGLGLIGAMETSLTPVYTLCLGSAMSMGFALMLAGHKRFAHRLSTFMYHELSYGIYGSKLTDHKQLLEVSKDLQVQMDEYVKSKTKITQDKLDDIREKKVDWYMTAQEALEYGVIDEIYE